MTPIRFICPQCQTVLTAPPSAAGKAIECGRCQARLAVPGGAAPPPPPSPDPSAAPPALARRVRPSPRRADDPAAADPPRTHSSRAAGWAYRLASQAFLVVALVGLLLPWVSVSRPGGQAPAPVTITQTGVGVLTGQARLIGDPARLARVRSLPNLGFAPLLAMAVLTILAVLVFQWVFAEVSAAALFTAAGAVAAGGLLAAQLAGQGFPVERLTAEEAAVLAEPDARGQLVARLDLRPGVPLTATCLLAAGLLSGLVAACPPDVIALADPIRRPSFEVAYLGLLAMVAVTGLIGVAAATLAWSGGR